MQFLIADPGLSGFEGHHFETSIAFALGAKARGCATRILAGPLAPEGNHHGIALHRWFSQSFYELPAELDDSVRSMSMPERSLITHDLLLALDTFKVRDDDVVFFHTSTPLQALFAAPVVMQLPAGKRPQLVFLFRYDFDPTGFDYAPWFLKAFRSYFGIGSPLRVYITFLAETRVLAEFYSDLLEVDVHFQPHIDCSSVRASSSGGPTKSIRVDSETDYPPYSEFSKGLLRVAILGEARTEKGFADVPAILSSIYNDPGLARRVHARVQTYASGAHELDLALKTAVHAVREIARHHPVEELGLLSSERYQAELDAADVIIAPHRLPEYAYRGSGIVTDARSGGKILIVRSETSFAREEESCFYRSFTQPEDIVHLLATVLKAPTTAQSVARRVHRRARITGSPKVLVESIIELTFRNKGSQAPSLALLVAPLWKGQGSGHVFQEQVHMLRRRGYFVACVFLAPWCKQPLTYVDAFARELEGVANTGAFATWWLARESSAAAASSIIATPTVEAQPSFFSESVGARQANIPKSLKRFVETWTVSLVLVNYPHLRFIVDDLWLEPPPVIVETHDVRAVQYSINTNQAVRPLDVDLESAHTARADAAVFINLGEEETFQKIHPDIRTTTAFPLAATRFSDTLRADRDVRATVIARMRAYVSLSTEQRLEFDRVFDATTGPAVLMVGSSHQANLRSLDWYLASVAPLVTAPHTLYVAGDLASAYPDSSSRVRFLGRVEDLHPLYMASDVSIAPVRSGTGLPIKVLDALAYGMPLAATLMAVRGLAEVEGLGHATDNAAAFADRLNTMLLDTGFRRGAELDSRSAWSKLKTDWDYDQRWAAILDVVTPTSRPKALPTTIEEQLATSSLEDLRTVTCILGVRFAVHNVRPGSLVEVVIVGYTTCTKPLVLQDVSAGFALREIALDGPIRLSAPSISEMEFSPYSSPMSILAINITDGPLEFEFRPVI